jgi:uncharacterized protein involved in type VI secretion and phage assembly
MTSLGELMQANGASDRIYGVVTGVVTNNQDPDGLGRVKLKFPWLSDQDESWWARMAVPMAGDQRGTYFLPDVDDEVLVAFEHGDVRFPYVIGALWHAGDPPAAPSQDNADGANARRTIRTGSGLTLTFDDTDGAEQIEIASGDGNARIVISAADGQVTIEASNGVSVRATDGPLTLEGADVTVRGDTLKLQAQQGAELTGLSVKLEASAQVDVKGSVINLG